MYVCMYVFMYVLYVNTYVCIYTHMYGINFQAVNLSSMLDGLYEHTLLLELQTECTLAKSRF